MIGMHVKRKDINTIENYIGEGYKVFQVFVAGPMNSKIHKLSENDINFFNKIRKNVRVYVHSSYLTFPWNGTKFSIDQIGKELKNTKLIADSYIIHLPKYEQIESNPKQFKQILQILKKKADKYSIQLILEVQAYSTNTVDRINNLLKIINKNDCYMCIDTAHIWSSGVDISTTKLFKEWYSKIKHKNRVLVFHLNNSKVDCGSKVDRHEVLSKGKMWKKEELEKILKYISLLNKDIILETYNFK